MADVNNCATQRGLSEEGWQQAKMIGEAFEENSIPIRQVISSEYCRTWETADLAFGDYEKNSALNPLEENTEEEKAEIEEKVISLLTTEPESRTNTIVVGHSDIFEVITEIYPDPQGIAYILKPLENGSFEIIANMLPEEWSELEDE